MKRLKQKTLLASFVLLVPGLAFACDPAAKARAAAVVYLQSSDKFLPEDGVPSAVKCRLRLQGPEPWLYDARILSGRNEP